MAEYKFGVTGQGRKELVNAISEILETKAVYMKTPTYAYAIGNISIDKNGTGTGEFSSDLLAELAERGFQAEIETPEAEAETPAEPEVDTIAITLPLNGWTPEAIDNLCKMVLAKEMISPTLIQCNDCTQHSPSRKGIFEDTLGAFHISG